MRPLIQTPVRGVLCNGKVMDAVAVSYAEMAVSSGGALEREFRERLMECSTLAFRVALGVLRNRAEAEDVAQDTMLRAYRNFHRLRDPERFRSWLIRIAWRMAIDHQRAGRRRMNREQDVAMNHPRESASTTRSAEEVAASREFERRLGEALDELPDKLRLVMVMAGIEGYNTREVAELLRLPEATVKSRMRLARARLVEKLR
ncbi:MAG TPA: sigma-70 family RNA polymerase sigma factor [Candidatus Acidoferrales bacterium]|nr:sigma-70 family RNA polymerase sigma factor [Candidatus Acidoferrales bacterium]